MFARTLSAAGALSACLLAASSVTAMAMPAGQDGGPLSAQAVKKELDVTWEPEQKPWWCGPSATRMAMTYRIGGKAPGQAAVAYRYMGNSDRGTDDISLVTSALNDYEHTGYYESKYISDPPSAGQRALLRKDLVYDIDRGYPLVANVVSGWRPPAYPGGTIYHFVAVVGYDASGDRAEIADPAAAGHGGSDPAWRNVPKKYWISTSDLAGWIGAKGYSG